MCCQTCSLRNLEVHNVSEMVMVKNEIFLLTQKLRWSISSEYYGNGRVQYDSFSWAFILICLLKPGQDCYLRLASGGKLKTDRFQWSCAVHTAVTRLIFNARYFCGNCNVPCRAYSTVYSTDYSPNQQYVHLHGLSPLLKNSAPFSWEEFLARLKKTLQYSTFFRWNPLYLQYDLYLWMRLTLYSILLLLFLGR